MKTTDRQGGHEDKQWARKASSQTKMTDRQTDRQTDWKAVEIDGRSGNRADTVAYHQSVVLLSTDTRACVTVFP